MWLSIALDKIDKKLRNQHFGQKKNSPWEL
jgi:hypothetical protein